MAISLGILTQHFQTNPYPVINNAMINLRPPNAHRPIAALQCWSWDLLKQKSRRLVTGKKKCWDLDDIYVYIYIPSMDISVKQPALPRVATQGLQVQPWHAYTGIYQLRMNSGNRPKNLNLMNSLDNWTKT